MGGRKPFIAIEKHPKRDLIVRDLIKGQLSQADICRKYGVNRQTVNRYLHDKLMTQAAAAAVAQDRFTGGKILDEIDTVMRRIRMMYDAAHEYLLDCKDPTRYDLGPRAMDMTVVYQAGETEKGAPIYDKALLQELLNRVEGAGMPVTRISYRIADPRKLILETADTLTKEMELIARIQGKIKDVVMNVTMSQSTIRIKEIVLKVTEKYPEIRELIIDEIERATENPEG